MALPVQGAAELRKCGLTAEDLDVVKQLSYKDAINRLVEAYKDLGERMTALFEEIENL